MIVFAAIMVLGTSWMLLSAVSGSGDRNAGMRLQNGEALLLAKSALLAYVVTEANTNNNPGKLPCPVPVSGGAEGVAAASCSLPAIGRLPWKTIGLHKVLDSSGEQLWYVVSANWATPSSGSISINSNTPGQLSVDGAAGAAVALIIAPGAPLSIQPTGSQSAAGCVTRNQSALRGSSPPNYQDYLDCQNNPAGSFATSIVGNATNAVFNDQVVTVKAEDIMQLVEGIVAKRIGAEIAPAIQSMYASSSWGTSSTNPIFPFAAPFGNPASASYQGVSGTFQGLVPFTIGDCAAGSDPRCDPSFVQWLASPLPTMTRTAGTRAFYAASCGLSGSGAAQVLICTLTTGTSGSLTLNAQATARNVGMSLRMFDTDASGLSEFSVSPRTASGSMNADGSAQISFTGAVSSTFDYGATYIFGSCLPYASSCKRPVITIPIALLTDPPVLRSSASVEGWYTANRWHEVTYYATAPSHAPDGAAPRSCAGAACLSVSDTLGIVINPSPTANGQRALLILAGRRLSAASANSPTLCVTTNQPSRPSGSASHYLECVSDALSNSDGNLIFVQARVGATFNDRIVLVDQNP